MKHEADYTGSRFDCVQLAQLHNFHHIHKLIANCILVFLLAVLAGVWNAPAFAADTVSYVIRTVDSSGNITESEGSCTNYTPVESSITQLTEGWYVVNTNVSINGRIPVTEEANLILCDGCTLSLDGGINVAERKSLTIYGQTSDSGTLTISGAGSYNAGIGGGNDESGGTITIHGGTVNATGGEYAAGIGGGNAGEGGTITIYGGNITAIGDIITGGNNGAGIGGGNNAAGGTITIYGGSITAIGGYNGAGIGGGDAGAGGTITITGGSITAIGGDCGAGIGGGDSGTGGTLNIYGGNITATGNNGGAGIGGDIFVTGGTITLGYTRASDSITASTYNGTSVTVSRDQILTDGTATYSGTLTSYDVAYIAGKTLRPYVYTLTLPAHAVATPSVPALGTEVTLSPATGYRVTSSWDINGENISGNTFTMPAQNTTVSATLTPIEYTIKYDLKDGTLPTGKSNPTSYTVESDSFTLTNPVRYGYTFTGWILSGDEESTASTDLTISIGSTGDRNYLAIWTRDESVTRIPAFAYNSLILSGQIGVNFYVDMPAIEGLDYTDGSQCWMTFTISGKGTVSPTPQVRDDTFTYETGGTTYYGFRCYINSLQMADTITATLHYVIDGQEHTTTQSISAKNYLDFGIGHESDGVDKSLLIAIKDYGHYAQNFLAKEHSLTLGDGNNAYAVMDGVSTYTFADYAQIISALESDDYAIKTTSEDAAISKVEYSLNLDSTTAINLYFHIADVSGLSSTVDNGPATSLVYDSSKSAYKVVINDISAHKLSELHTVTIKDSSGNILVTVKVRALSYVYTVLTTYSSDYTKDTNGACDAMTAIYKYYKATMAYRAAKGYAN